MKIIQQVRQVGNCLPPAAVGEAQLALVFSTTAMLREECTWKELRATFPHARIVACSTAGEIAGTTVYDNSVVCTGIRFEYSHVEVATVHLDEAPDSQALGALLGSRLPHADLAHVFVLSDGLNVNGSSLVTGIIAQLPASVAVTGGLSADGSNFQCTAVCVDGPHPSRQVVAIGFYGSRLKIGYGCLGGWDSFGPERRITKAEGNVLYELDGEPALDLYKRYLGEHAGNLPASGLLFPLTVRSGHGDEMPVVRTILSVDESARSLTFAGDVPLGYRARLMRANFERLVDGASEAAKVTQQKIGTSPPELAILVSCVGRKLVLKRRPRIAREYFWPKTTSSIRRWRRGCWRK